jgi:hypothetical protein
MTAVQQQLFIVGSPRSGTTLLRNVLNGHTQIALTAHESHLVPSLLLQYGTHPHIQDAHEIDAFLRRFKRGLLYKKGRESGLFSPTDAELADAVCDTTWAGVLRGLFNLYSEKNMTQAEVWGDKTPAYVDHIDLIDAALPRARFIHIIRDPRDQALSERAIWKKSLRRSAYMWRKRVMLARTSRAAAAGRYKELTYEGLARDPERELRRLTAWLGLDYEPAMLEAASGSDELGQMVGAQTVSDAAIGGRRNDLSVSDAAIIASLAGDVGRSLTYDLPTVAPRRLGRTELSLLTMHDRLGLISYYVRRKGLVNGIMFAVGTYIDSRRT